MRCLVIGATGYVGARLVPRLLAAGHGVRCLVRDPVKLSRLDWASRVEVCRGDLADGAAVEASCSGIDGLFYLAHAMDGPDFVERDRSNAGRVAGAALAAGVRRVVYLGGLQPGRQADGSAHLASRREVGEVLVGSGPPTAVLRAGIVVGAGSASFEMIRHLAHAGPVLPLPDRAWNAVQPVGIDDVLHHLVAALELPARVSRGFDIGGPDVLSYRDLVAGYAELAGLRRPLSVPVPVSLPRLTARLAQAFTPVGRHLAGPLFASMAHDLICRDDPPWTVPGGSTPYREAVRRALDGVGAAGRLPSDPAEPELVDERVEQLAVPPAAVWAVIETLGGATGWYTVPGVWAARGAVDRLVGGVGARRTRPPVLAPGAALDWWRIEAVEPGRLLRLRAEMRMPGTAHLELGVEPEPAGSRYTQRVTFRPRGPAGLAFWGAQLPAHRLVFGVMARTLAGEAVRLARAGSPRPAAAPG